MGKVSHGGGGGRQREVSSVTAQYHRDGGKWGRCVMGGVGGVGKESKFSNSSATQGLLPSVSTKSRTRLTADMGNISRCLNVFCGVLCGVRLFPVARPLVRRLQIW